MILNILLSTYEHTWQLYFATFSDSVDFFGWDTTLIKYWEKYYLSWVYFCPIIWKCLSKWWGYYVFDSDCVKSKIDMVKTYASKKSKQEWKLTLSPAHFIHTDVLKKSGSLELCIGIQLKMKRFGPGSTMRGSILKCHISF